MECGVPDYAGVFQTERAVLKYDEVVYEPGSYGRTVDARQRRYVRRLVARAFPGVPPTQHDFACGSGRAVDMLAGMVGHAHGYDVSPAMLARAAAAGHAATWHLIAPDGELPEPADSPGRAVVTVFRLLLNAPPEARDRAVAFAARVLPHRMAGLLVVQNHGSRRSLRHLSRGRNAGNPWYRELDGAEVEAILARHGFRVLDRRGFALFPQGWYRPAATRWLVRRLDGALCAARLFDRWAVDVLYVAVRDTP
jgi:hypothetical protein